LLLRFRITLRDCNHRRDRPAKDRPQGGALSGTAPKRGQKCTRPHPLNAVGSDRLGAGGSERLQYAPKPLRWSVGADALRHQHQGPAGQRARKCIVARPGLPDDHRLLRRLKGRDRYGNAMQILVRAKLFECAASQLGELTYGQPKEFD
jgi:hypothetical protein